MDNEHDHSEVPTITAISTPAKPVWVLDFANRDRDGQIPDVRDIDDNSSVRTRWNELYVCEPKSGRSHGGCPPPSLQV